MTGVGMEAHQDFTASPEGMAACQAFLSEFCTNPKPQVIMDEIVSNIVRCSGANSFSLRLDVEDGKVNSMVFTDDGAPFNPTTEAKEPNLTAKLDEREVGGLGIFLVKKMSKTVTYTRDGGRNVLTVTM